MRENPKQSQRRILTAYRHIGALSITAAILELAPAGAWEAFVANGEAIAIKAAQASAAAAGRSLFTR